MDARGKIKKIGRDMSLVTSQKMTAEERRRIKTDIPDIMDLGNFEHVWCWIDCSLRLSGQEVTSLLKTVNAFAAARNALTLLTKKALDRTSTITDVDGSQAAALYEELKYLRRTMEAVKSSYAERIAGMPKGPMMVRDPDEGSGTGSAWAADLAAIYTSTFGPHRGQPMPATQFVDALGNAIDNGDVPMKLARRVHNALMEFGTSRSEVALNLSDYIKKNKAGLPAAFTSIVRA